MTDSYATCDAHLHLLQLINAALDISPIFEAREDVVTRHTCFTSKAPVADIMTGVEQAAIRLGATSERRGNTRSAATSTAAVSLVMLAGQHCLWAA